MEQVFSADRKSSHKETFDGASLGLYGILADNLCSRDGLGDVNRKAWPVHVLTNVEAFSRRGNRAQENERESTQMH